MKLSLLILTLASAVSGVITAQAGIYTYGSSYNIPNGSLGGVAHQVTVSGEGSSLSDISVAINVSGGYNGDLYAYLSYNGALVPLLNRVGVSSGNPFGASGAGLNVTLSDSGTIANGGYGNIHAAGAGVLSGTWQPDGQSTLPLASATSFSASGGSITLDGTFGTLNPNGVWTLFFADVSAGGSQAVVNGWSLDITAVPEPVNVALGLFGLLFAGVTAARWRLNRKARLA
jgi:hypothetical protein